MDTNEHESMLGKVGRGTPCAPHFAGQVTARTE